MTVKMLASSKTAFLSFSSELRLSRNISQIGKALFQSTHTSEDVKKHQAKIMSRGLPKKQPIAGVKQVLLVASGKGGVGKSTTAVNLATAIKVEAPNKEVGILDSDVFGPSIPLMMNLNETPFTDKNGLMLPLENYGIKCMSMGFLVDEKSPVIWRGLMVMQALDRLLRQVNWGSLDYLIVDTPPGTGDTHLSLVQNIPIAGVILVTTPQSAALSVTRKGANMFKKLNVPIIGIVQNMGLVECPQCLNKINLFGNGTAELAKELDIVFLENIPLHKSITDGSDSGIPVIMSSKESIEAKIYRDLAKKVLGRLNQDQFSDNREA